MRSYLQLALLLGIFLITAHCEEDGAAGPADEKGEEMEGGESEVGDVDEAEGEGEGGEVDEMDTDDEAGGSDTDDEAGDGGPDEDDGEMEKMDPLTDKQMTGLHKKIDTNANGKVSLAEATDFAHKMRREWAQTEVQSILKDMDTDKDGKLSNKEFVGAKGFDGEKERKEEFKEADLNKDGFMDHDEIASHHHFHHSEEVEHTLTNRAMGDKDGDKNGALTLREFFHHLQIEGEDPVEIPEDDQEVFRTLDTDGSGTLTLKELKVWESGAHEAEDAVKKLFAKADANKDNVLTAEELISARHALADDTDYVAQMYLTQWATQHDDLWHSEL